METRDRNTITNDKKIAPDTSLDASRFNTCLLLSSQCHRTSCHLNTVLQGSGLSSWDQRIHMINLTKGLATSHVFHILFWVQLWSGGKAVFCTSTPILNVLKSQLPTHTIWARWQFQRRWRDTVEGNSFRKRG